MNKTIYILKTIAKSRMGYTARKLYLESEHSEYMPELQILRVMLTKEITRGRLRVDEKIDCTNCGTRQNCYRITDKGRMFLAEKIG